MKKKTIGIIGAGSHFQKKIYPILKKSNFYQIKGVLKHKKKHVTKLKYYNELNFFKQKFDFVYISCPNNFHSKYILKSLKSNYHIICEKPFVSNSNNFNKIINLSKKKRKLIFESFSYTYHPVFIYVKRLIKQKKFSKIKYVVSNFCFPSLDKKNNRYDKNKGNGFFLDAATYPISLDTYLFNIQPKKIKNIIKNKIKSKVDLRGFIKFKYNNITRFYFWGEGQSYTNNIRLITTNGEIYIDKIFSKHKDENIYLKIFLNNSKKIIKFKPLDQFEQMFHKIQKNYNKNEFQNLNRKYITNQLSLISKLM